MRIHLSNALPAFWGLKVNNSLSRFDEYGDREASPCSAIKKGLEASPNAPVNAGGGCLFSIFGDPTQQYQVVATSMLQFSLRAQKRSLEHLENQACARVIR
jgi:hypothetical protein